MKAAAFQSTSDSTPANTHKKAGVQLLPISPWFIPVSANTGPLIQRKSNCACGGDCPRCEAKSLNPSIQTKLAVSTPGDAFELEADRVADQVMRMPASAVAAVAGSMSEGTAGNLQRKCACGGGAAGATGCDECSEKLDPIIQRQETPSNNETCSAVQQVPTVVQDVLSAPAPALDSATRAFMEPRFGNDFSAVRIHTDAKAAESAQSIHALAYTVGSNIVFSQGQYSPHTDSGRRLLAHELTHVVQQGGIENRPQKKLAADQPLNTVAGKTARVSDAAGSGIDRVSDRVTRSAPAVQRACGAVAIGAPAGCTAQEPVFLPGYPLYRFNSNCDDLAPGEKARLITQATALPASAQFEVHGFTSTAGDATFNENLSCARALKARSVLTDPVPGGAGIAAARVTGVFKHGPTPGPAASRSGVVVTPPRATPLPAAVPAAGATDFRINQVGTSTTSRLYFASGVSALNAAATAQVTALKAAPPGPVRLIGYASADEPATLAQDRADAVRVALTAPPTPIPVVSAVGNAPATATRTDFTEARSVEILVGATPPATQDCSATNPMTGALLHPPKQPCPTMDPLTWTAFNAAQPIAVNAMARAVAAVAGAPSAADAVVIDRFFGNHTAATLGTLRTNLTNLQAHVVGLTAPGITQCGGQCDAGGCAEGPIAYNTDVDAASRMTLCVPVFRNIHINDQVRNLIHESAHGTTPLGAPVAPTLGTRDVAYRHERMLFQLSPVDRLRNSDSYALFALFLREIQITANPAAVPAGISTPPSDTITGFGADEPALRLALARMEKRATWATDWTGQLYGQMNDVRSGAATWATSWAENLMRAAAERFPLTVPPAVPTLADVTRMAGILDRFGRMKIAAKRSLGVTRMAAGGVSWPPSAPLWVAGSTLQIGPDFFRATPADQVSLLFEALARATRDVEPAFVPAYVSLAQWIHEQNP